VNEVLNGLGYLSLYELKDLQRILKDKIKEKEADVTISKKINKL
tara:strand:+ start:10161 stop:10292 length:132 start_codon:yes stop_codon:yes gene_type:complete